MTNSDINKDTPSGVAEYAGFTKRTAAIFIDNLVILGFLAVFFLIFVAYPQWADNKLITFMTNWFIPVLFIPAFWFVKQATPGKMFFSIRIVDEKTLKDPTSKQLILRYAGYLLSVITLFIGFAMIAFTDKNQGLHDKIAGTVVIYS